MWCVLWLSWKPLKLLLLVKGPHNWVLLLYYTLWFLHTLTSKSSPHLTTQVSAFLMVQSLSNTQPSWSGLAKEVEDKEIQEYSL